MQLASALHVAREDVNEVEIGLVPFGEVDGGFVGDDLRVCESIGFVDGFRGFGWKALFDVVCFCLSVMPKSEVDDKAHVLCQTRFRSVRV